MKHLTLSIGGKTIASIPYTPTPITEPIKTSQGFNTPVTGVVGEVESVSVEDGNTAFVVGDYTVTIGPENIEWLKPGARVKVDFFDGTILLIKNPIHENI